MPETLANIPMGLISVGRLCHRNFLNIGLLLVSWRALVKKSEEIKQQLLSRFLLENLITLVDTSIPTQRHYSSWDSMRPRLIFLHYVL